jgi:hypothetical protein
MDWTALNASRRVWQPNEPTSIQSLAPKTISRCLALTALEPAVAGFIEDGLTRADRGKLDEGAITTLLRNIEDEDKHEIALTRARNAMTNYDPSYEDEAQQLIQAWKELEDPEILKAAILENSIFFLILPLYANFGGSALAITSNSISADERIHVISHRTAAQQLGIRPSKKVNELRKESVRFISADLQEEAGDRWTIDRMMKNSDSLLKRGISDMIETQTSMAIAPFEVSNEHLDKYA